MMIPTLKPMEPQSRVDVVPVLMVAMEHCRSWQLHHYNTVGTGRVAGSIFLVCDKLLRVQELVEGTTANFISNGGVQV